jgi:hypothetical protein
MKGNPAYNPQYYERSLCHNYMALPRTEGGGEGTKMWGVSIDARMPNNQL